MNILETSLIINYFHFKSDRYLQGFDVCGVRGSDIKTLHVRLKHPLSDTEHTIIQAPASVCCSPVRTH